MKGFSENLSAKEQLSAAKEIEQDKERTWLDLENVGPEKPVGYLPIDTIEHYLINKNVEEVTEYLKKKGLEVRIFIGTDWPGHNGSLYAYDRSALQKLLDENRQTLIDCNWPITSDEFVANLNHWEANGTPVCKIIAKAFADKFSENLEKD